MSRHTIYYLQWVQQDGAGMLGALAGELTPC